jgi:tetratricopeptide (TPR) repeat protein
VDRTILLERFEAGRALVERTLIDAHQGEGDASGTLERWTAKDLLAHIAAWEKRWVDWLELAGHGKPLDDYGPRHVHLPQRDDEVNAQIFAENQPRTWSAVLDESRRVFGRFLEIIPLLSEDEFANPERFAWMDGSPFWRRLSGTFFWHPATHVVQHYIARGENERAMALMQDFARLVGDREPAVERGIALYNLACIYSLGGKPEQAMAALQNAFALHSDLVALSRQDGDLDALRARPDFQAFYEMDV